MYLLILQCKNLKRIFMELYQSENHFAYKLSRFLEVHLKDSFYSSTLLAEDMGMSLPTLYNRMKSHLGLTPHTFINNYKMNRALEMLRNGLTIDEVCDEIGASATSNFNRSFKQKFGVTPGKFRQISA